MEQIIATKEELLEGIQVRLKSLKAINSLIQYASSLEAQLEQANKSKESSDKKGDSLEHTPVKSTTKLEK